MQKLRDFILYNNTVPLMFGVLFLGAGVSLAASPDAREAIYTSEEIVEGVDNSFILATNVETYPISVIVETIEEDELTYYVTYALSTIDVADGVWQPVEHHRIMEVQKEAIAGSDLGLYVSEQLAHIYEAERRRLRETQDIEKTIGNTKRKITTTYGGLVGRAFDPESKDIEGYDPVFAEPDGEVMNPLSKAELKAQQEEQAALQEEKKQTKVQLKDQVIIVENQIPETESPEPEEQLPPSPATTTVETATSSPVEPEEEPSPDMSSSSPATPPPVEEVPEEPEPVEPTPEPETPPNEEIPVPPAPSTETSAP